MFMFRSAGRRACVPKELHMTAINCDHVSTFSTGASASIRANGHPPEIIWSALDPLEEDAPSDIVLETTDRSLVRLAIAASDAGARFEREGLEFDPAAWLMAPRTLFDGRAAIEACMHREGFRRNLLLHGLHLGLDANPTDIDTLLDDGDGETATTEVHDVEDKTVRDVDAVAKGEPDPQLRTCWLDLERDGVRIFTFCALVSDHPEDIVERVIGRFGKDVAATANFRVGFDHSTPLGVAMISDALADTLALAACDPRSPLAEGLDMLIEQRFKA